VVALIVLGPKRLPEVGRSLGKGLRDFKSALGGEEQAPHAEVLNQTSVESTTTNSETAEHVS
jgi:sec-independent protein translocase protein TatA